MLVLFVCRVTWTHWPQWRHWPFSGMNHQYSKINLLLNCLVHHWIMFIHVCNNHWISSLLRNPVTNKKHYRLYVINKIPQIRVLDFQRVKLKVCASQHWVLWDIGLLNSLQWTCTVFQGLAWGMNHESYVLVMEAKTVVWTLQWLIYLLSITVAINHVLNSSILDWTSCWMSKGVLVNCKFFCLALAPLDESSVCH